MKRCLMSLVIWKMKLKTTTRCHFTPTRMLARTWRHRSPPTWPGDEKWGRGCGNVWRLLEKLNTERPGDPAITLLRTYPREIKIHVHTKTCPLITAERKAETTPTAISRCTENQGAARHTRPGVWLSRKGSEAPTRATTWMSLDALRAVEGAGCKRPHAV